MRQKKLKNPYLAFFDGISTTLLIMIFGGILLLILEIYGNLYVMKWPLLGKEFYMVEYPFRTLEDIFDLKVLFVIFLFLWLYCSVVLYFSYKKKNAKIQEEINRTKENEEQIRMLFDKIEELENLIKDIKRSDL